MSPHEPPSGTLAEDASPARSTAAPGGGPPLIEADGLTRRFGGFTAVQDVSFAVRGGEIFGFLGPNGAGKTTTIKMLVGLLRPTEGVARIGGHDLWAAPVAAKRLLGYVPDQPSLPEKLTARELLDYVAGLYDLPAGPAHERAESLLALFDLADRGDELLEGYSHGMGQKAALAAALLPEPRALFLDEPTVGLDPRSARRIKGILRERADAGAAVVMSTHILEIAEAMCDRVGIIHRGRIVAAGSLDELRTREALAGSLEDIFLQLTEDEPAPGIGTEEEAGRTEPSDVKEPPEA